MMRWSDCLKLRVKKIRPDFERSRWMRDLALKRINSINRRRDFEEPEFIVEDYYETIKELATCLLFAFGYKSYSHECLISFLKEDLNLGVAEVTLINQMRKTSDLLYRGEPLAKDYLTRREKEILEIIEVLLEMSEKTLKGNS